MDNDEQLLQERFARLPKIVQNAIASADVEKHLRELSKTHQLHLDQWQELETEVMAALMGFKPVADLEKNIKAHVRVNDETARALADSISKVVFAPIREELERFLTAENAALQKEGDPIEDLTAEILKEAGLHHDISAPPSTAPTTPVEAPIEPPKPTVTRSDAPESYKGGQPSGNRKDVHNDPYRLPPDA